MAGYSAVGSALPWGGRGRGFKSRYSDQIKKEGTCLLFLHVLRVLPMAQAKFNMFSNLKNFQVGYLFNKCAI